MPVQQRHLRSLAATCFRDRQQVTLVDWWQRPKERIHLKNTELYKNMEHGIVSGKMGAKCFYGRKMLFRALESLFDHFLMVELAL